MTTLTWPRIEAYLWSDGSTTFRSLQRFSGTEGATTSDRVLPSSQPFSAALDTIVAGLSADLPGTYAWTMSADGVLTLSSTANWSITWYYRLKYALGFTGTQSGTDTYASSGTVLLCCPLLGAACEPAEDGSISELVEVRHGRDYALHYATIERWRLRCTIRTEHLAAVTAGFCSRGRVRVYLSADTSANSEANLDGYVDGYIYSCKIDPQDEDDGIVDVELLLARTP
jgi:hypothetical protein